MGRAGGFPQLPLERREGAGAGAGAGTVGATDPRPAGCLAEPVAARRPGEQKEGEKREGEMHERDEGGGGVCVCACVRVCVCVCVCLCVCLREEVGVINSVRVVGNTSVNSSIHLSSSDARYALIPLVMMKTELPSMIYTSFLVLLHIFVLVVGRQYSTFSLDHLRWQVYIYKVNFRALDPDWKSLSARVLALVLTSYLLYIAARKKGDKDTPTKYREDLLQVCIEMFLICIIHTIILVLLVVRIRYPHAYKHIAQNSPDHRYSAFDIK